jgi:fibronectin type 3 domain-containing protein
MMLTTKSSPKSFPKQIFTSMLSSGHRMLLAAVFGAALAGSLAASGSAHAQADGVDGRTAFLSPLFRAPGGRAEVMPGALRLDFLPELLDAMPVAGVFNLVQFPFPDGTTRDLSLSEFEVLGPEAVFAVVENGPDGQPKTRYDMTPQVRTFRGRVIGDKNTLVFLAFGQEAISGFIRTQAGTFTISNGPRGEHPVVISDLAGLPEGAINWKQFTCNTPHIHRDGAEGGIAGDGGIAALQTCKALRMAFETDNEFRGLFGSNQAALDYLEQLAAGMNTIYFEDENLYPILEVARVYSPGTEDPWDANGDSGAALDEFSGGYAASAPPAGAISCGVKHFISAKNLGGGIAQDIGGTCNNANSTTGHCVSGDIGGFFPYPLDSNNAQNWDIVVTTHETGHLLGCWHTHQQTFDTPPGQNYDECGNGGCAGASSIGTIMSYCHLCPGGLANIALVFAPVNIDNMDKYLEQQGGSNCQGFVQTCPIFEPRNFAASDGDFADACVLTWRAPAVAAESYDIERRLRPAPGAPDDPDSGWETLVSPLFAAATFYRDTTAELGIQYEYRIRALPGDPDTGPVWVGPDDGYRANIGPINLSATDGDFADRVALTWEEPPTTDYVAVCYRIYRADGSGEYQWIDESSTLSYEDTGTYANPDPNVPVAATEPGVIYSYRVRALTEADCGTEDGAAIISAPTEDTGFKAFPGPSNVVASGTEGGAPPLAFTNRIRVSWTLPGSVNRVYVYRSVEGGPFEEVAALNGSVTSWSDTLTLPDVGYTYKARSFQNLLGLSAFSNEDLGFRLDPPAVTSASDGTGSSVLVRWTAPTSWRPTTYSVWRKRSGRDPWPANPIASDLAGDVTSFTDTTGVSGDVYVYAVTGRSGNFSASSDRGRTDNGYPTVLPPTGVTASDGAFPGFVYITWTSAGATTNVSWQVFRRVAGSNSAFTLIRTTTQPNHYDSTAVVGTTYEYHIRMRASNGVVSAPSQSDTGRR